MRNSLAFLLVVGLLLSWGGCTAPAPVKAHDEASPAIFWPNSPAEARIRYVRSVSSPESWGITRSWFRRMMDALAGQTRDHFIRPTGVAESDGVLYVADPGAQALWIFDVKQQRSMKITEVKGMPLASPVAVAVRPDGAVFVADTWLNKVFLFDRAGKLTGVAAEQDLKRPAGLAYDARNGLLYVADAVNHNVSVYDRQAKRVRSWGREGSGDGEFNHPTHISVTRNGTVLVTDALNFRVQAFDGEGHFLWKFGRHGDGSGDFAAPKGVATDSEGHVYVVDALFDAVQIFDKGGALYLTVGERGTQPGQFWLPNGIFINPQNEIFVTDPYNQRIQILHAMLLHEESRK